MKQIERDLLTLRLANDYLGASITELIPNYDKNKTYDLFIKTFKDDAHLEGVMIKMAQDAYSRVEKKLPKI